MQLYHLDYLQKVLIYLVPAVWREATRPTSSWVTLRNRSPAIDWDTASSLSVRVEIDPAGIPGESWQALLAVATHRVIPAAEA